MSTTSANKPRRVGQRVSTGKHGRALYLLDGQLLTEAELRTAGKQTAEVSVPHRHSWDSVKRDHCRSGAQTFIAVEKKCLVLSDRGADRTAELVSL